MMHDDDPTTAAAAAAAVHPPRRRSSQEIRTSLPQADLSRFYTVAEEYLCRKQAECLQRCPDCWHNATQCLCQRLPSLSVHVRIIVYMHYLEYMNSNNTGKFLRKCLGAELLLYGRRHDDDRLRTIVEKDVHDCRHTVLLFPSEDAMLLDDFLINKGGTEVTNSQGDGDEKEDCSPTRQSYYDARDTMLPITLIVLDATYRKAKNMAKHFYKRIDTCQKVKTVKLNPDKVTASVFARAQKSYGKKAGGGRVCTVEAVAHALGECGESKEVVNALVDCVKRNNVAMDPGNVRNVWAGGY